MKLLHIKEPQIPESCVNEKQKNSVPVLSLHKNIFNSNCYSTLRMGSDQEKEDPEKVDPKKEK